MVNFYLFDFETVDKCSDLSAEGLGAVHFPDGVARILLMFYFLLAEEGQPFSDQTTERKKELIDWYLNSLNGFRLFFIQKHGLDEKFFKKPEYKDEDYYY